MKQPVPFFLLAVLIIFPLALQAQDEVLQEEVKVVNVEVPVRVFLNGKPVDNLARADFKLYENGVAQEINGFFIKRKTLLAPHYEMTAGEEKKEEAPPRYFALVFNITDFTKNLELGLDYAFDKILTKEDRLLLMVNRKVEMFDNLEDKELVKFKTKTLLREEAKIAKGIINELFNQVERRVIELKHLLTVETTLQSEANSPDVWRFLQNYQRTWEDLKRDYLTPDVDDFYYFAKYLEDIKGEKWVINFYQIARFPQFKATSETVGNILERMDRTEYNRLNFELHGLTSFPSEQVSKIFYKVNATFHSIFIPTQDAEMSEDLSFNEVTTAFENCLKEITDRTGGKTISSGNLEAALSTIRETEDIYYMLTYEPSNPGKVGKIRVELTAPGKKYELKYDDNMRSAYIRDYLARKEAENPQIRIKEVSFKEKSLGLVLTNFLVKKEKKATTGSIEVRVRVESEQGEVLYDKARQLTPGGGLASVKVDFDWLKPGNYYILADIRDALTGKTEMEFVRAVVGKDSSSLARVEFKDEDEETAAPPPQVPKSDLDKYLLGAAGYCENLRKGAFHYFCKEKVVVSVDASDLGLGPEGSSDFRTQVLFNRDSTSNKMKRRVKHVKKFVFDYQILSEEGKITEQRKLISGEGSEFEKQELGDRIVSFLTERAVFGPVTLLSRSQQGQFEYKLLKYEKKEGRQFAVIEALPKSRKGSFSYGKVWIDTGDYSVRKIKLDPRSIKGYAKLQRLARMLRTRLFLSCEIEYKQVHNGLRFPTQVTIIENYKGGPVILRAKGYRGWDRTRTTFDYKDYRFFEVDVTVEEER